MAVNGSPFSEIGLSIGTRVVCKLVFVMLIICSLLLYVLKDFITNGELPSSCPVCTWETILAIFGLQYFITCIYIIINGT